MADDILKNIPLPADLPENWTSQQTVAPTGAEVGLDEQHGYNYLMKQVNNAQKAAAALNEGKLGLHADADNGIVASGAGYVRFGDGTQICWGHIVFGEIGAHSSTFSQLNFAVPFANTDYAITTLQTGDVGNTDSLAVNLVSKTTTNANVSVFNSKDLSNKAGLIHDCIAIGQWK